MSEHTQEKILFRLGEPIWCRSKTLRHENQ